MNQEPSMSEVREYTDKLKELASTYGFNHEFDEMLSDLIQQAEERGRREGYQEALVKGQWPTSKEGTSLTLDKLNWIYQGAVNAERIMLAKAARKGAREALLHLKQEKTFASKYNGEYVLVKHINAMLAEIDAGKEG